LLLTQKKDPSFILLNKITQVKDYNFTNSIITFCVINDINIDKYRYKSILNIIYNQINDPIIIISNTKINIKLIQQDDKGYTLLIIWV